MLHYETTGSWVAFRLNIIIINIIIIILYIYRHRTRIMFKYPRIENCGLLLNIILTPNEIGYCIKLT